MKSVEVLIRRFDQSIGALKVQCGLMSEEAWRRGMAGILREVKGLRVDHYLAYDEEGEV